MGDLAEKRRLILQRGGECIVAWSTVEWSVPLLYGEWLEKEVTESPDNWLHAAVINSVTNSKKL